MPRPRQIIAGIRAGDLVSEDRGEWLLTALASAEVGEAGWLDDWREGDFADGPDLRNQAQEFHDFFSFVVAFDFLIILRFYKKVNSFFREYLGSFCNNLYYKNSCNIRAKNYVQTS